MRNVWRWAAASGYALGYSAPLHSVPRSHRTMFDLPSILLWAFATGVSAVMMASLIHRRREQLTGQLRDYVGRHLSPPDASPEAEAESGPQDTTDPIDSSS